MQNDPLPMSSPLLFHSSPPPSASEDDMADDEDDDESDLDSDEADVFMTHERPSLWYEF